MGHLVNTSLFLGFEKLTIELGGDPNAILRRFDIPKDIEYQKDSYVPFSKLAMLYEFCAETFQCPDFGLRLSARQGFAVLGPVAVLARNAKTVEEAIRGVRKYLHLISPSMMFELTINPDSKNVLAEFRVNESGLINLRQVYELYIGNGQLILQLLTGSEIHASCIYLPHRQLAPKAVYRDFFRCDVKFNQVTCAAEFPVSILQQNVLGADPDTAQIANSYLTDKFGGRTDLVQDQVEHLIVKLLPTGHCRIGVVADQLNMHPRTLQRRLASQTGTNFDTLVDQSRKMLAQRYLAESTMDLTQIAGLLGYADQSTLNRSCQRWFKRSPKSIRHGFPSEP